jgi:hypothetical protein
LALSHGDPHEQTRVTIFLGSANPNHGAITMTIVASGLRGKPGITDRLWRNSGHEVANSEYVWSASISIGPTTQVGPIGAARQVAHAERLLSPFGAILPMSNLPRPGNNLCSTGLAADHEQAFHDGPFQQRAKEPRWSFQRGSAHNDRLVGEGSC